MSTQSEQITLTPVLKGNGKFDYWEMAVNCGKACGPASYPPITVGKGNNADFTVTIDNTGQPQPILFSSDPVWIGPGPNKPTGYQKGEIHDLKGQGTSTITFKDHNWDEDELVYQFNFSNAPPLDPIINNDGGGPHFTVANLVYTSAAVALASVVALTSWAMFNRQSPSERRRRG